MNQVVDLPPARVDGASRMRGLILDLLAYSRVGRSDAPQEEVDTDVVCERSVDNVQGSIEETGAQIICHPLPRVKADVTQLGQLLQNLIGNALKYRAERTPDIEIGAEAKGDFWQFYVKDNGIGIAPEYAQRIFVIFQCLHAKEQYSGTGIGLGICKKIVERAGR